MTAPQSQGLRVGFCYTGLAVVVFFDDLVLKCVKSAALLYGIKKCLAYNQVTSFASRELADSRAGHQVPLAIRAATQAGMLDALQTNNGLLDQIMKCLEAYLVSSSRLRPVSTTKCRLCSFRVSLRSQFFLFCKAWIIKSLCYSIIVADLVRSEQAS